MNPSTADQRQISFSGGCGWSEKTERTVENKTPSGGVTENLKNNGELKRELCDFRGFDQQIFEYFTVIMMA